MKKYLLYLTVAFLTTHFAAAQVLYTEDFDNLTVGNVSTDITGTIPGQGGWYTKSYNSSSGATSNFFLIENEINKGKVMTFKTIVLPNLGNIALMKKELDVLIKNRSQGNNVIEIAFDCFLGSKITNNLNKDQIVGFGIGTQNKTIVGINFFMDTGNLAFRAVDGKSNFSPNLFLLYNRSIFDNWINFRVYLDYDNKKVYFNVPTLNVYNLEGDFLNLSTLPNLFDDFTPENISFVTSITDAKQSVHKIDNIKITALNKVPLNISEFLNEKIQVFPNPASNIVHITNSIDVTIEEINIYDVTGKLIKTEKTASTENMVLNIEDLTSGSYLIHIKTSQGTAVKKIVKK